MLRGLTDRDLSQSQGYVYTMSNCLYASLIQRIVEECDCRPTFAVTGSVSEGPGARWCEGSELACLERMMTHWGDAEEELDGVYNSVTGTVDRCLSVMSPLSPHTSLTSLLSYYRLATLRRWRSPPAAPATPASTPFPRGTTSVLSSERLTKSARFLHLYLHLNILFCLLQDNYKRIVFERHYRGRFSCATFPADLRRKCRDNPSNLMISPAAQEAATEYARENLALIKIFIRLVRVGILIQGKY